MPDIERQMQILSCLKWLGEFQLLALVPLTGSIPTTEVAGLAGVSPIQLDRVVRMTATVGFMSQPEPDSIAHTPLSTALVTDMSLLDATMFLAESVAPASLHMTTATQRQQGGSDMSESAFSISHGTTQSFEFSYAQQKRLQRQWSAFHRCVAYPGDSLIEVLGRLDWHTLNNPSVVDVSNIIVSC